MNHHVQAALRRDSPDWHLKHACPACTYKLKNEQPLLFKMLYTMDGNDSLRWILRQSTSQDDDGTLGPLSELPSACKVPGDRYLSHEDVDKWAAGVLQEMMGKDTDSVRNFTIYWNHITNILC